MTINDIHTPADIKGLGIGELEDLSEQLRAVLIDKLAAHGGHVGPNLGVVEATVALHYVFDAPTDRLVFDVSHQSYVHKMLTGRIKAFTDPAHYNDVSGYTNPKESRYDLFSLGHTSSAISLACGLAKARDLKGDHYNVVAFIGDASLGGGEAFEGLDTGATLGSNFIVIVNDNQMSIAENHGGIYENALKNLRDSNGTCADNLFRAFGYGYVYVRDGNNLEELIRAFRGVKNSDRPVVVHINTMKGMGLPVAEEHKEAFHWHVPFNPKTGAPLNQAPAPTYPDLFAEHILELMGRNKKVVALTAGTPGVFGFTPERRAAAGNRFIDVGIAEQNCTAMAAGLARNGMQPVFGVMATFLQRAYDQLFEEVGVNNMPVVIVTFGTGVFGVPDETHLGWFDIPMVSNIPGLVQLAPTSPEEFMAMVDWAVEQADHPVVIRCPGAMPKSGTQVSPENFDPFTYQIVRRGADVALIAEGGFLERALAAADILAGEGIKATVINPRVLSDIDCKALDALSHYSLVITMEDGQIDGGFGQKVAAYLSEYPVRVICKGLPKEFLNDYSPKEVLTKLALEPAQIAAEVKEVLASRK